MVGLRDRCSGVGVGYSKQDKEMAFEMCGCINYRFSDLVNLSRQAGKCIVFWVGLLLLFYYK